MNDTLAVLILSNMQERNSAKLLGAVAEADVEKAKKINNFIDKTNVFCVKHLVLLFEEKR